MTNLKPILTMAALFLAVVLIWQIASITGFALQVTKPANVTVNNTAPTSGPITCTNPIVPLPCANTTETCYALINDDNGQGDMASWTAELFDTNAQPGGCAADNVSSCYYLNTCTNTSYNSTAYNITCNFNFRYFSRDVAGGNWTIRVNVTDRAPSTGSGTNASIWVQNLTAIDVAESYINFGTLSVGQQSSAQSTTELNCGNYGMYVQVSGTSMPCTTAGTIGVGNITYNLTSTLPGTALNGSNVNTGLDIARALTDAGSNGTMFWWVKIPAAVKGVCTANITFYGNRDS